MIRISVLCIAITFLLSFQLIAKELPVEAQQMLDELGAPEVQQRNNGKKFQCKHGGHKTIIISPLADATLFTADYNNCREAGSTRDGYYEVIIRDWEIVGKSSKRSINGELQDAARAGDVKKVGEMVGKGADVNYAENFRMDGSVEDSGWTPLMSAAMTGNIEIAKLLVNGGAWVNYMNSRVISALFLAANGGFIDVVKLLVEHNAYINNSDFEQVTPLMAASMNGHQQVVKYLVEKKAGLNLSHKDGDSALMFALANRHSEIAQFLIEAGADINIRNRYGASALLIAIAENNESIVSTLIMHKADTTVRTSSGKNVLEIAISKGNENIIKMLKSALASGA
jgi:ankyrin repeat protein